MMERREVAVLTGPKYEVPTWLRRLLRGSRAQTYLRARSCCLRDELALRLPAGSVDALLEVAVQEHIGCDEPMLRVGNWVEGSLFDDVTATCPQGHALEGHLSNCVCNHCGAQVCIAYGCTACDFDLCGDCAFDASSAEQTGDEPSDPFEIPHQWDSPTEIGHVASRLLDLIPHLAKHALVLYLCDSYPPSVEIEGLLEWIQWSCRRRPVSTLEAKSSSVCALGPETQCTSEETAGPTLKSCAGIARLILSFFWPVECTVCTISHAGIQSHHKAVLAREFVETHVAAYQRRIARRSTRLQFEEATKALSFALLHPLADIISNHAWLTVIPTGRLYALQFETMVIDKQHLCERAHVSYANSLTEASRFRSFSVSESALSSVGCLPIIAAVSDEVQYPHRSAENPSSKSKLSALPYAVHEADDIARLMRDWMGKCVVLKNRNVRWENVQELMALLSCISNKAQRFIVHCCCHFVEDAKEPVESALVLAGFEGQNMTHLHQLVPEDTSIVFLSACSTSTPQAQSNLAVTCLSSKGPAAVITTHWDVSDSAAFVAAHYFYTFLSAGEHPVEALSKAKRQMKASTLDKLRKEAECITRSKLKARDPEASDGLEDCSGCSAYLEDEESEMSRGGPSSTSLLPFWWAAHRLYCSPFQDSQHADELTALDVAKDDIAIHVPDQVAFVPNASGYLYALRGTGLFAMPEWDDAEPVVGVYDVSAGCLLQETPACKHCSLTSLNDDHDDEWASAVALLSSGLVVVHTAQSRKLCLLLPDEGLLDSVQADLCARCDQFHAIAVNISEDALFLAGGNNPLTVPSSLLSFELQLSHPCRIARSGRFHDIERIVSQRLQALNQHCGKFCRFCIADLQVSRWMQLDVPCEVLIVTMLPSNSAQNCGHVLIVRCDSGKVLLEVSLPGLYSLVPLQSAETECPHLLAATKHHIVRIDTSCEVVQVHIALWRHPLGRIRLLSEGTLLCQAAPPEEQMFTIGIPELLGAVPVASGRFDSLPRLCTCCQFPWPGICRQTAAE